MSAFTAVILCLFALAGGGLIGWLLGGRGAGALKAERDLHLENFKAAIRDLETAIGDHELHVQVCRAQVLGDLDARHGRLLELHVVDGQRDRCPHEADEDRPRRAGLAAVPSTA